MNRAQWLAVVVFFVWASIGIASDRKEIERIATPAGTLTIQQLDQGLLGSEFGVSLGRNEVLRTGGENGSRIFLDFPVPRVISYFGRLIPPFSAVAVFQQYSWGNACNGGPIWFLGIRDVDAFVVSEPIDYCGGAPPIISVRGDAVRVVLPASKRAHGDKRASNIVWIFRKGVVKRAR